MSDILLTERDGGIVTVTLNRPEIRNPISDPEMVDALEGCLRELDADIHARVVILTGAGATFSSGGNLKNMGVGKGLVCARGPITGEAFSGFLSFSNSLKFP